MMLSFRTAETFLYMIQYCISYPGKTCLFFVPSGFHIPLLYKHIPVDIIGLVHINRGNSTINFENKSRIIIRTPALKAEKLRGYEIDWFEEFGLVNYDVWNELKLRTKSCKSKTVHADSGEHVNLRGRKE